MPGLELHWQVRRINEDSYQTVNASDGAILNPNCWYMVMKSKLFQPSAIFPS